MTQFDFEDRTNAERALRSYAEDLPDVAWPPTAHRICERRLRLGLAAADVAQRIGITPDGYRDLENNDSEAFVVLPLARLASLAEILQTDLRTLLLGHAQNATPIQPSMSFSDISQGILDTATSIPGGTVEFGDRLGWDCQPIVADPQALWNYDVGALFEICTAIGVDWVSALPTGPTRVQDISG